MLCSRQVRNRSTHLHAMPTAVTIQLLGVALGIITVVLVVFDFVVEVLWILILFSVVDGNVVFDFGSFVHGWVPSIALTAQCEARLSS